MLQCVSVPPYNECTSFCRLLLLHTTKHSFYMDSRDEIPQGQSPGPESQPGQPIEIGPPSPPPKPSHLTGINRKVGINSFPFFFSQVGSAVANQDRQHSRRGICTAGSCTAVARVSILLACLSLSLITLCGSPRIRRVRLALAHWISVVFFLFPFHSSWVPTVAVVSIRRL